MLENPSGPKLSDHVNEHGNGILLGSNSHDQSGPVYQDIDDFSSMRISNTRGDFILFLMLILSQSINT